MPSRAPAPALGAIRSVKYREDTLDPVSNTCWNSPLRLTRCAFDNPRGGIGAGTAPSEATKP